MDLDFSLRFFPDYFNSIFGKDIGKGIMIRVRATTFRRCRRPQLHRETALLQLGNQPSVKLQYTLCEQDWKYSVDCVVVALRCSQSISLSLCVPASALQNYYASTIELQSIYNLLKLVHRFFRQRLIYEDSAEV